MTTSTKILLGTFIISTALTACNKTEQPQITQNNIASVAETQTVPMSAIPADDKTTPTIITDANTTTNVDIVGEMPEIASTTNTTETATDNDNSAMENISEDAEVIDDEPASPNAPTTNDTTDNVNQKIN